MLNGALPVGMVWLTQWKWKHAMNVYNILLLYIKQFNKFISYLKELKIYKL